MCPPTFFSIDYEINPWMKKEVQVDQRLAGRQWKDLFNLYTSLGVEVDTIRPAKDLPDMVFTANAGLVFGKRVVLANFRYPQRKPESAYFAPWFEQQGYEVIKLDNGEYFEGQGESLWFGDKLISGVGFRSNQVGQARLREFFTEQLVSVKLVDPKFYHLDTCFLPIDKNVAAYYPAAFDQESATKLKNLVPKLIEVAHEEALVFACNSVVVGKKVIMPRGSIGLRKKLKEIGYEVISLEISEFKKSGGGIRCLTLTLEE